MSYNNFIMSWILLSGPIIIPFWLK
jgi:hypothetical protein